MVSLPRRIESPPSLRFETILVFCLMLFVHGYFLYDAGWNAKSRLDLVFAVVEEGRLTIDSYHDQPGFDTFDKALYKGHYYSDKGVGVAALGIVVYAPLRALLNATGWSPTPGEVRWVIILLVIGIPSAISQTLFYVLCREISGSRSRAYLVTAVYALGTMSLAFSALLMGHQLAASLLFAAFYVIARSRDPFARSERLLIGLLLAYAVVTVHTTALIAVGLALYYMKRQADAPAASAWTSAIALPLLGGALPIALQFGYNIACFEHPLHFGYNYPVLAEFAEGHSHGLFGISPPNPSVLYYLTLHPARGLLWQSPVLLSACIGLAFMLRDRAWRAEALMIGCVVAAMLLVNSGYYMWWGGATFGPRHVIGVMPFLSLALIFLPRRHRWHLVALGSISAIIMMTIAAQHPLIPGDFRDIASRPLFADHPLHQTLAGFARGEFASNLGMEVGLNGALSLVPLLGAIAAITAWMMRKET